MSAATALAILAIPAGWAALDLPYQQRLLPGVVVRGVDLGGVPFDQAQVRLNQALRQRSERIMLLRAAGGEWGVQLDHLLSDPNDRAFDAARRYGHESSPPTRLRARLGALVGERQAFDDNPVDSAAVLQLVRQLRDHIDRPGARRRARAV